MRKKAILAVIMAVLMMFCIVHFGTVKAKADSGTTLTIFCWNDEFKTRVESLMPNYTKINDTYGRIGDLTVKWMMYYSDNGYYQNNLDYALTSYYEDVDIFLIEADYADKYLYPGIAKPLNEVGITASDLANQYKYTKQIGSYNGVQYASTWQTCCGGMIYNRDIAKKVLGTDDPANIQAMISDWSRFESVAKKMKAAGYKMTPCASTDYRVFYNNMNSPWVTGGKVNVDSHIADWIRMSKNMVDAGQTGTFGLWDTNEDFQRNISFCVFGPAWYFDYCMQCGSGSSIADRGGWALCEGPEAHFWGGTWMCVADKSDNPTAAGNLIKTMTTNENVLFNIAYRYGDNVNNKNVINYMASDSSLGNSVLGGQNPYTIFKDSLTQIDLSNTTIYDQICNEAMQTAMTDYFTGKVSYNSAINNFYLAVTDYYPELSRGTVYDSPVAKAAVTDNGIKVSWNSFSGAAKYRVFRKTGNGDYVKLATTTSLNYVDTTAEYGKTYIYAVRALTSGGSYVGSMSQGAGVTYMAPALKLSLSSTESGVKVTWPSLKGAAKYRIYKKNSSNKWVKLDTVTELKYVDKTAVSGQKCTYTVIALTSGGSEMSEYGSGKSIKYVSSPITPTLAYKASGVSVTWKEINGAAKYRIFRKTGSGDWAKIATTTSLSYVDKTVVYGKTYTYAVRAMSSGGSFITELGSGKSIKYQASAPKITLKNQKKGILVSWSVMSGAEKYRIFVKNSSGSWTKLTTVKDGTCYLDTAVKEGKSYTYAVVGMDSAGRLMNDYGSGKTIKRTAPVEIMNISLKSVASGVKISWTAYEGAGKYRVYRTNSDGAWAALATIKVEDNVLFYRDTTVKNGKNYTYTVVAMTSGGSALTEYGNGTSITYVKPAAETEVLEAEVVDVEGNTIVRAVTEDEISEDFTEIITENLDDDDEETGEATEETGEATEETGEATEETGEATEETGEATEETGEATEETGEEADEESEDVIREDTDEVSDDSEETKEDSTDAIADSNEDNIEQEEISEDCEEVIVEDEAAISGNVSDTENTTAGDNAEADSESGEE